MNDPNEIEEDYACPACGGECDISIQPDAVTWTCSCCGWSHTEENETNDDVYGHLDK